MTATEALLIKRGDFIRIGSEKGYIQICVLGIEYINGEDFFVTDYGNFNASVCQRVEGESL